MKKLLILFLITPVLSFGQAHVQHLLKTELEQTKWEKKKSSNFSKSVKKIFKYSTFYSAVTGGNSISNVDVYSVTNGLETNTVKTPFDYSVALGVRKIARFGYENRTNVFFDGTEKTYGDAATIGKINGFEFLFEADWTRQQGTTFFNQDHFLRYVAKRWIAKAEYLQDGFADISYFEASERFRQKVGEKLSFNIGAVQRISEPYGYNPLDAWMLSNGNLHYTDLAIQEGYDIQFDGLGGVTYYDPNGQLVAENTEVWEAVVVPQVLADYTEKERNALPSQWNHSLVLGFDFYHYTKTFWLHSWGNIMPLHLETDSDYSYHGFNGGQWIDYSGGLIFGYKINKSLGVFLEGKYHKYWNRQWHNFSVGINYIIL
tara:strand:+ start:1213 stop:2331 length:1119 start_codon:yes stop_codon:yes gene_type:complete